LAAHDRLRLDIAAGRSPDAAFGDPVWLYRAVPHPVAPDRPPDRLDGSAFNDTRISESQRKRNGIIAVLR
jgi:hypothetical protein